MDFILWIIGGFVQLLILMRLFPAIVYDILIVKMISRWYDAVLLDLGPGVSSPGEGVCWQGYPVENNSLVTSTQHRNLLDPKETNPWFQPPPTVCFLNCA